MKPPSFVKELARGVETIWCLANDNSITVEVEKAGRLNWDDVFRRVITKLQNRGNHGFVIDVGAYIGDSTRWFELYGYPCIAFEAQRDAFTCLQHNCQRTLAFNLPVGNGDPVIVDHQEGGNMGARQVFKSEAGISTIRIDDLQCDEVACIKIDVEGYEPSVLEGARETIARCKPIVVCEINPKALEAHGFVPLDIFKHFPGWQQEEIFRYYSENWDILFTPPS